MGIGEFSALVGGTADGMPNHLRWPQHRALGLLATSGI